MSFQQMRDTHYNDFIDSLNKTKLKFKFNINDIHQSIQEFSDLIEDKIINESDSIITINKKPLIDKHYKFNDSFAFLHGDPKIQNKFDDLLIKVRNLRKNTRLKNISTFGLEYEAILHTGINEFLQSGDHLVDEYNKLFTDYEDECSIEYECDQCYDNNNYYCSYCSRSNSDDEDDRCDDCSHCRQECDCRYDQDREECDHLKELITYPLRTLTQMDQTLNVLHNGLGMEEVNESLGQHITIKLKNYQKYTKLINMDKLNTIINLMRVYGKCRSIERRSYFSRLNSENHFCRVNKTIEEIEEQLKQTRKAGDIRYTHFNFKHGYLSKGIELRLLPMFSSKLVQSDINKLLLLTIDYELEKIKTKKETIIIKSNIPRFNKKPLNLFSNKFKINRIVF